MTLAILAVVPRAAVAGDLAEFNAAASRADVYGRNARFYLLNGNPGLAGFELGRMARGWQDIRARFADDPPAPFAGDPVWHSVFDNVEREIATARAAATEGDAETARKALARQRAELAALRARNGVWVFSDCVDEIDRVASGLWTRHAPPYDLTDEAKVNALRGEIAVLRYLFGYCRGRAPRAFLDDAEFLGFVDGSIESLGRMSDALERDDPNGLGNAIGELRSFVRLLFLRFG